VWKTDSILPSNFPILVIDVSMFGLGLKVKGIDFKLGKGFNSIIIWINK
jgi:hypothetical protein